jgi:hypothetical protein
MKILQTRLNLKLLKIEIGTEISKISEILHAFYKLYTSFEVPKELSLPCSNYRKSHKKTVSPAALGRRIRTCHIFFGIDGREAVKSESENRQRHLHG